MDGTGVLCALAEEEEEEAITDTDAVLLME